MTTWGKGKSSSLPPRDKKKGKSAGRELKPWQKAKKTSVTLAKTRGFNRPK